MMTKVSWTCQHCGIWHSKPDDAHLRTEFCTYDGLESAEIALAALSSSLLQSRSPELLIKIESIPMNFRPSWLSPAQRDSEELRSLILSPVKGQPFHMFCSCGFDSTGLLKPGEMEFHHVSIPMVPK